MRMPPGVADTGGDERCARPYLPQEYCVGRATAAVVRDLEHRSGLQRERRQVALSRRLQITRKKNLFARGVHAQHERACVVAPPRGVPLR